MQQLNIIIILFFFNLYQNIKSIEYQNEPKECICECCLDDNENCKPTFRSAVNINPSLACDSITCNQESCLTFSQCSIAFGKTIASCQNKMRMSSLAARARVLSFAVRVVLILRILIL